MPFHKAQKSKAKARVWVNGQSSSGKTFGALAIAKGLGGKVAMIDSEAGRGELHGDRFDYDVLTLSAPFLPEKFVAAIKEAEMAGYDIIIIDSASHEWMGTLEMKAKIDEANPRSNSFTNWNKPTAKHNAFIEAVVQSKCHVILTSRVKRDWAMVEQNGKTVPKAVGLANVQRDGLEYEMLCEFRIEPENHMAYAIKDNTGIWLDKGPFLISEETGRQLKSWLESGSEETAKEAPLCEGCLNQEVAVPKFATEEIDGRKFCGEHTEKWKEFKKSQTTN